MDAMKEMKVAFDFLLTKKANIKSIIKKHGNINDVMEIVCDIFNAISDSEFFDWCEENIEGFQGGEIEQAPQYWCGIKE